MICWECGRPIKKRININAQKLTGFAKLKEIGKVNEASRVMVGFNCWLKIRQREVLQTRLVPNEASHLKPYIHESTD